jgi:hypothetical protein
VSFVVSGFALESAADVPEVVVAGKGHRYVVWLNPFAEDGVTKPPLTDADITRYCGAAEGFAQRIHRLTNGRHRIFQVEFNYGSQPMRHDIQWNRHNGTSFAPGLGSKIFYMHDAITLARHTWSEGSVPGADSEKCDANSGVCVQADCPPGLIFDATGANARELCLDGNGNTRWNQRLKPGKRWPTSCRILTTQSTTNTTPMSRWKLSMAFASAPIRRTGAHPSCPSRRTIGAIRTPISSNASWAPA